MRKFIKSTLLYSASVLVLPTVVSIEARAQSDSSGTLVSDRIEEIVVTAQKVQQSINDVGMSITALTEDSLTKIGVTNPDQLTKVVPGLNVTDSGNGSSVYTLRGIGYYDVVAGASPAVSLYVDEIPLAFPMMARGAALDAQRVEVLKGPQGTLFGQNATGGAINFIANRPTDVMEAGADATYSSYNHVQAAGFLSGPISNTLKFRVALSGDHGGAWQRSVSRDESNGTARFYSGRALLDWMPVERLTVQFNLNGWVDKSDEQAGQIVGITNPANPAMAAAFAAYPRLTSSRQADWDTFPTRGDYFPYTGQRFDCFCRDNYFYQFAVKPSYQLTDNINLISITAYGKLHQDTIVDNDGINQSVNTVTSLADIKSFSQELRLTGKSGPAQWVVGANYAHDTVGNIASVSNDIASYPFRAGGADSYEVINTYAAFAHVDYALTNSVNLLAGVRYTIVPIRNRACTIDVGDGTMAAALNFFGSLIGQNYNFQPGDCVTLNHVTTQPGQVYGKLREHNVPFKLGVNWKLDPRTLLYASINRGYKAGNFSPVGGIFDTAYDPATQESVLAYEAGFKLGLADNHVQLNGAGFYYDYSDKQIRGSINDPSWGPITKTINVPKSRIVGGELQLMFVPNANLQLNAGVTYVDSRIQGSFVNYTASGLVLKELGGESLPLTPKWQAQADAEYSVPLRSDLRMFFGGHYQYQGSTFGGLGEEDMFRIDSYSTVDLRAGIKAQDNRWSASVFVNNVADKYSWNSVNHNGADAITRLTNPPRIFGIRGSVRY